MNSSVPREMVQSARRRNSRRASRGYSDQQREQRRADGDGQRGLAAVQDAEEQVASECSVAAETKSVRASAS